MIDIVGLERDLDRLAAAAEAFGPAADQVERSRLLAQIRHLVEQLQRLDEAAKARLARSSEGRAGSAEENRAAAPLLEDEEAAAKSTWPVIQKFGPLLPNEPRWLPIEAAFGAMRLFLLANGYDTAFADEIRWAETVIALVEHRMTEAEFVRKVRPFVVAR